MKKLLLPCIFFCSALVSVSAQQGSPANFLSLNAGPNYFDQPGLVASRYKGGKGYTVGLEYARALTGHLRFQIGLRYNLWHSKVGTGDFLTFESEYLTGQYVYDPSLPHYLFITRSDKAWQVMAGPAWYSSPKKWQWNLGLEAGTTMIRTADLIHRFTAGVSAGASVRISPRFQCFLQPAAQRIFVKSPGYSSWAIRVETGVRAGF